MKMKATILRAAITVLIGSSAAQANTTEALLYECEQLVQTMRPIGDEVAYTRGGYCLGYMNALIDVLNSGTALLCGEKGMRAGQMARLFVRYGQAHPEKLNLPPLTLLASAMSEAYPCKQ
jgi:hypothetical protein